MNDDIMICPFCEKNGKEIELEIKHGMARCPNCSSSINFDLIKEINLEELSENWKKHAENIFPLMMVLEPHDIEDCHIYSCYKDVYQTLFIGRYTASIILMGVLLEAIVKERIRLKTGKYFKGSLGNALNELRNKKLMDNWDIIYLKNLKDEIRNPYQHVDDEMILKNKYLQHFPLEFKNENPDLAKIMKLVDDAVSGKIQPTTIPADTPEIRKIAKERISKKLALILFNNITEFLIAANVKYFNNKEYLEYEKKFESGFEGFSQYHKV